MLRFGRATLTPPDLTRMDGSGRQARFLVQLGGRLCPLAGAGGRNRSTQRDSVGQSNTGDKLRSSEVHRASSASSPCSTACYIRLACPAATSVAALALPSRCYSSLASAVPPWACGVLVWPRSRANSVWLGPAQTEPDSPGRTKPDPSGRSCQATPVLPSQSAPGPADQHWRAAPDETEPLSL